MTLGCGSALAQSPENAPRPARAPDVVIRNVQLDDLRLIVDEMGGTFLAAGQNDMGAPFVFARLPDGLTLGIYSVCADEAASDCRGVEFMAAFGSVQSYEQVTEVDRAFSAVSVYKADQDTVNVSRYVILDRGITWGNLIENAAVFDALCSKVAERLAYGPPQATASAPR
ncbi:MULTISPECIES: hypothetical protein [Hyphomonas]|uniref:YbjN domain-containing protein n=1 Tax=Hyphomonas adhaerens TaxID=81029 RepID=A0A3B9H249_9PROT|nr:MULTISPECIES: hypothetical protein [Hyphomonas]MBB40625.1 hypothetical protein [Hyphomonas sp.]HAE28773.1 hypothetical protein [Hyphomonas adhaerens]|tara:strand:+ start:1542 stop:2051 length:510 start_codon:yes stop_codon:yes gene_type:complete